MKALKLSLIAILACAALVSCKKKDETTDETAQKKAQYIEYLTNKKGWVLESATSSPAYELSDGGYATNLMTEGYLLECELDEVIKFAENGGLTINPGNDVCDEETEYAATWSLSEDLNTLNFQLPFFYDDEIEKCQILSLTENQLRVKYTFDDYEAGAKTKYSFTVTYKINK
jgi:hypothetical protein